MAIRVNYALVVVQKPLNKYAHTWHVVKSHASLSVSPKVCENVIQ